MIAFLRANSCFTVRKELEESCAKAHIFVGKKEQSKMIRSAHRLSKMLPDSTLEIMDQWYHGEFSLNHAKEYAEKIIGILDNK